MKNEYNFFARIYDPVLYFFIKPVRMAVLKELNKYRGKSILDLCCGTGNQLKLLANNGFRNLHCLDLSCSMLEIAKKNNTDIKIFNADAANTGFKDESFDIIILSFAIHEKDRNTQQRMINESYRILKKEGILLIADFIFDDRTKKLGKYAIQTIEWIAGGEHYRNFKEYRKNNGLNSLIDSSQFKIEYHKRKLQNGVVIAIYGKV